nr:ribonuclease PH [Candidatus Sigynarchaeota archaeon]
MVTRKDGRNSSELRPIKITKNFIKYPEGSVLFEQGDTKVIVNVTIDEDVPNWMKNSGTGWVTAEYSMLPRSTHTRQQREREGRPNTRSMELSRLVGRALRPVIDMNALGPKTIRVDCDVIQADGGTRCASITGAFLALKLAEQWMLEKGIVSKPVISKQVAAISVGIMNGNVLLDLNYEEDKDVGVDLNVIMTSDMKVIEIQGTAEHEPISRDTLNKMFDVAERGLTEIFEIQRKAM